MLSVTDIERAVEQLSPEELKAFRARREFWSRYNDQH